MIKLMGLIHKDGVSDTLNIFTDRIFESSITPISIVTIMMTWVIIYFYEFDELPCP